MKEVNAMSVPPGNRGKSAMQFLETADNIERRTIQLCRRWPKSYMFLITQRTVDLASEIYEHAQKANAIIPQNEAERTERALELQRAMGSNYAYAKKIELAYSLFPLCGEKDKASDKELAEKSNKILEELMNMCLDEEESLKGNLHWTRTLKLDKKSGKSDNNKVNSSQPESGEEL